MKKMYDIIERYYAIEDIECFDGNIIVGFFENGNYLESSENLDIAMKSLDNYKSYIDDYEEFVEIILVETILNNGMVVNQKYLKSADILQKDLTKLVNLKEKF